MTPCDRFETAEIELYFYGELDPLEHARVEAHVGVCAACRQHLDELHVIRLALAARPRVDAPPAGDWSGFMRRLDDACRLMTPSTSSEIGSSASRGVRRPLTAALAIAASVTLIAIGAALAARLRPAAAPGVGPPAAAGPTASVKPAAVVDRTPNRALADLSEEHFERSKLVVLSLAARDPQHTTSTDLKYERDLAGTLLSDTRLYRLAAEDRGLSDIAHVMSDLETVLLEASMSDFADPTALERVQKLIRKRDLVVKMQLVGSTGI